MSDIEAECWNFDAMFTVEIDAGDSSIEFGTPRTNRNHTSAAACPNGGSPRTGREVNRP